MLSAAVAAPVTLSCRGAGMHGAMDMASKRRGNTALFLILALLPGAWGVAVQAAEAPVATASTATGTAAEEPLEELEQIVVRGESIIKAIADAEDNFYDLYNKLNTDDDYDTSCVYLQLDPTSRMSSRVC